MIVFVYLLCSIAIRQTCHLHIDTETELIMSKKCGVRMEIIAKVAIKILATLDYF